MPRNLHCLTLVNFWEWEQGCLSGESPWKYGLQVINGWSSILLGYSCYYLTRNSLTFTAPAMVATPSLGLDITSIGVITSIFPLCYGCSKFVSGVVGDMLSPAIMLGGGLVATGLVWNVLFSCGKTNSIVGQHHFWPEFNFTPFLLTLGDEW